MATICKMGVRKADLLKAINSAPIRTDKHGVDWVSFDFLIGIQPDKDLCDCVMSVPKKRGEYDKPAIEVARFRTLEKHKLFMQQFTQYVKKVEERKENLNIDF